MQLKGIATVAGTRPTGTLRCKASLGNNTLSPALCECLASSDPSVYVSRCLLCERSAQQRCLHSRCNSSSMLNHGFATTATMEALRKPHPARMLLWMHSQADLAFQKMLELCTACANHRPAPAPTAEKTVQFVKGNQTVCKRMCDTIDCWKLELFLFASGLTGESRDPSQELPAPLSAPPGQVRASSFASLFSGFPASRRLL